MSFHSTKLERGWELTHFDRYGEMVNMRRLPPALPNLPWIPASVPGSVYDDLMRAGWIPDVYAGCNTLAAQWVENQFWYYRARFQAEPAGSGERLDLVLDGLDLDAEIYLNGELLAEHHNAYRPLRVDISKCVLNENNELVICLSSGLLEQADKRGGDYNLEVTATQTKRAHLRKPHFACRWDWSPRLMNVGIGEVVRIERIKQARIVDVRVEPSIGPDRSEATLTFKTTVEKLSPGALSLAFVVDDLTETQILDDAPAGVIEVETRFLIKEPQLWWPRGYGAQPLYKVQVRLCNENLEFDSKTFDTAIRTVDLVQPKAEDEGTLFHLRINGETIFCKGANWVPADLIYTRTQAADFEQLVQLAVESEMNMLRIWGGGLYADPRLLDACDRAGILVWHDLMFACSKYPGDQPEFVANVLAEVRHQVRRLSHHPSLALWCGNNEIELGIHDEWITSYDPKTRPCDALFHQEFAELMASEDPSRPYWPTSPYSPDGQAPNDELRGDQHPWNVSLGEAKGDFWAYRSDASRFPNEGGTLGPSTLKTLRDILPPDERSISSRTWLHHDNTQNTWRGEPLLDDLLKINLFDQPRDLSFEDYIHYAGIIHGEALETAIDNWRRRKFASSAAVFWMFNDTWPATVSWTPFDYYRRRKTAFWYVKRCFAPQRAICVVQGEEWVVHVVNDTLEPLNATLRSGLFGLAGGLHDDETLEISCPANGRIEAVRQPLSHWDALGVATTGGFAVLRRNGVELSTQRFFRARFKDLIWNPAPVELDRSEHQIRLRSDAFAWSISLDPDGETAWPDNHFDLLPGIERVIPWKPEWPTPSLRISNPVRGIPHGVAKR